MKSGDESNQDTTPRHEYVVQHDMTRRQERIAQIIFSRTLERDFVLKLRGEVREYMKNLNRESGAE